MLTGTFQLGTNWAVTIEQLENRQAQILSVGESVSAAPDWRLAAVTPGSAYFHVRGEVVCVDIGRGLTGRTESELSGLLTPGRSASSVIATSPPGSGSNSFGVPSVMSDRVNRASGISETDAVKLTEYLKERDERDPNARVKVKGKKAR